MLTSRKTTAIAGILGGIALVSAGVAQAHGETAPLKCSKDAHGIHCSSTMKRTFVTEDGDKVVIEQKRSCKSSSHHPHLVRRLESQFKEHAENDLVIRCSNVVSR